MNIARRAGARANRHLSRRNSILSLARTYATEPDPQLDHMGYPKLPPISRQYLPPKGWDDQQMRRNYGDTLHEEEELHSMWGPDIPGVDPNVALKQFAIACLGLGAVGYTIYKSVPEAPAVKRSYPFDGLVKEIGGQENFKANVEEVSEDEE